MKTTAQADEESLQADWFSQQQISQLDLRCRDILPVITLAVNYHKADAQLKHAPLLPHIVPHKSIICKYVFYQVIDSGQYHVMRHSSSKTEHGLPAIVVNFRDFNIYSTTGRLLREIIKMKDADNKLLPKFCGVLSVEFNGAPAHEHDGVCLTLLVELCLSCAAASHLFKLKSKLQWFQVSDQQKQQLQKRIAELGSVHMACN